MTKTLGKMNEIPESASSSSHLIDDDEFDSEFYDLLVKEDAVKKSEQYGGQLITFSKNKHFEDNNYYEKYNSQHEY